METTPLIQVEELRSRLPQVTVLDVRWRLGGPSGFEEYAVGHVPGAAYVDLDTALAGPSGEAGRHPLPQPDSFAAAMRVAGVCTGRPVVVLDDWSGLAAARAWWLLRHHGHDDVRVLDGGWSAWRLAGGEVQTGEARVRPGDFRALPGRLPTVAAADVPGTAESGLLLDVRAAERFRGEVEPVDPVAGHIPGAVNLPTTEHLDAGGHFLSPTDLRRGFAAAGVTDQTDVTAYCGSGVTAAHTVLALTVIGVPARLYPGSWSEWVTDPERPVETGG